MYYVKFWIWENVEVKKNIYSINEISDMVLPIIRKYRAKSAVLLGFFCVPLNNSKYDLNHQIHAFYRDMLVGTVKSIAAGTDIGAGKPPVGEHCAVCAASNVRRPQILTFIPLFLS